MTIHIQCPQCSATYEVSEDRAGQSGKCRCGALIPIPAAHEAPSQSGSSQQTPEAPTGATLALTCGKCGQVYNLGQDAFAMTTSGALDGFAAATVLSDGAKSDNRDDPDLVDSCDWSDLNRAAFYRNEIAKIRSSIESDSSRWWQCRKCGEPQQYQQRNLTSAGAAAPQGRDEVTDQADTTTCEHAKVTERTIQAKGESLDEAKADLGARIPKGFYLASQRVLCDGAEKTIREVADTAEKAYSRAESQVPHGAKVIRREVVRQPRTRTVVLSAKDQAKAREKAENACANDGRLLSLTLTARGKRGFLGVGREPNVYEAQVVDLAIVHVATKAIARVTGCVVDEPPMELLYPEEQRYYPVAPVETMLVLCDSNVPAEAWLDLAKSALKSALDVRKLVPSAALECCPVTYHTANGDTAANKIVFGECTKRGLNGVIISTFEASVLSIEFSYLVAVLTTVPSGKEWRVMLANDQASVALRDRGRS